MIHFLLCWLTLAETSVLNSSFLWCRKTFKLKGGFWSYKKSLKTSRLHGLSYVSLNGFCRNVLFPCWVLSFISRWQLQPLTSSRANNLSWKNTQAHSQDWYLPGGKTHPTGPWMHQNEDINTACRRAFEMRAKWNNPSVKTGTFLWNNIPSSCRRGFKCNICY